ncbi:hypothetical protein [Nakamurella sp.]|uniref:hypothetical protein n=1 Tax=Nakamurella sp. TaxID=1869182 RepID=UPI0037840103
MTHKPAWPTHLATAVAALANDQRATLAACARLNAACREGEREGAFWLSVARLLESADVDSAAAVRPAAANMSVDTRHALANALHAARNLLAIASPAVADFWDEILFTVRFAGQRVAA